MQLIKYEAARHALQVYATVDEVKGILDQVAALQAYAKQQEDTEMELWLAEIKLRARRRIGEISAALEKAPSGRESVSLPTTGKSKTDTLSEAGLTTSVANRCEKIAEIPEEEFEAVIVDAKEKNKPVTYADVERVVGRNDTRKKKKEWTAPSLPEEKYSLIYADPPWRYEHSKTESRTIENQYPTMSLDDIKGMEVPAADDCILFLWATSPKLSEAMSVIEAWGFTYKTCAVWDKEKIGMGYYFRQQHELLLVAMKGSIHAPAPEHRVSSVYREKRGEHSAKPIFFCDLISTMYPEQKKIELFCRTPQEGWDSWGNQVE